MFETKKENTYKKRLTPIMGWASWNHYHIDINEALFKRQIDALVETGLAEVGYTYFNIDDGFFGGRDENGYIKPHPERFPNGMKVISDYVHANGLKAGIYSDGGNNTCAHIYDNPDSNTDGVGVGLYGYDEQDLRMYLIDWDYDFIKVDWCGGLRMGLDEETRYTEIGKIIEKISEEKQSHVIYNVCRWEFPGEWVVNVADSWRVSGDIGLYFDSVLKQIDAVKPLGKYHGPGHINDLDMLQVGRGLSYIEDQTHFAMWCMMSTSLMLGNDLTTISEETLSILKNTELIAINQDPACMQAILHGNEGDIEIWVKDLVGPSTCQKAIALLNRGNEDAEITVNWSELGFEGDIKVRDLWAHQDMEVSGVHKVCVAAHGTAVYKVTQ
ncbi:MAG: glycoside hydrolase family 27 protein [Niameybacter sp.]|uniref:glycoside hydrolase family 27 protein n=1 Tax=Niameybacter sp. TaxID=2033640 RepID=UPI002FC71467